MGTSLKVKGPVTQLLDFVPDHIPRILINNELVTYIPVTSGGTSVPLNSRTAFSAALIGSCDDVTQYICDLNGWSNDLTLLSRERASIKQEDASKPKDTIHKSEAIDMKTTQLIAIPVRRSQRPRSLKRSIEMVYEDSSIDGTSVSCFDVADSNVDIANSDKKSSACDPRCEIEPGAIVFETEEVNPHVFRLQRRRLID